jgi:hypothetical protein
MKTGDTVRIKNPTGGIRSSDRFQIIQEPDPKSEDWKHRELYYVRGEIDNGFGVRRTWQGGFHHSSLEVVTEPVDPRMYDVRTNWPLPDPPTNVHPDTAKRERAEADLKVRINKFTEAVVMRRLKKADADYVDRCEGELLQGIQNFKDACYAELDDEHGLGKAGLDAARDLVEHATVFHSAHVIDTERLENLAEAIGLERQD